VLNDAFEEVLSQRAALIIEINKKKINLNREAEKMIDKNGITAPPC